MGLLGIGLHATTHVVIFRLIDTTGLFEKQYVLKTLHDFILQLEHCKVNMFCIEQH